jgi:putative transcriptional regulator
MKKKTNTFNRIKAVLAEKGVSNLWLAESMNKNKATISKWCTNESQPSIETLFEIASKLEVEVRDLLVSNKTTT